MAVTHCVGRRYHTASLCQPTRALHVLCCSLKITPYFFYRWDMPADQQPGEDKYYRHSVVRWLVRDASYKQVEPSAQEVSDYVEHFAKCVSTAVALGFRHIFVSPMVRWVWGLGRGAPTAALQVVGLGG